MMVAGRSWLDDWRIAGLKVGWSENHASNGRS